MIVAIGAAITALVVRLLDRRAARGIAAEDRRVALEQAKLMFDLEALLRLSQNIERGGHTDGQIGLDMGAEAAAILNLIGPERLPKTWAVYRRATLAEAREIAECEDTAAWKCNAIEVHLELDRVAREIESRVSRR